MNTEHEPMQERVSPEIRMADIVLPNQINSYNVMFGGEVMAMMDKAAAIAALQFCRMPVATASSERIDFRTPIHVGEIIEAVARVIYTGRTSMIVRVHMFAEHPLEGVRRMCTTGYFSMVIVNRDSKQALPPLRLEDEAAHAEWTIGEEIRRAIAARRGQ